MRRSLSLCNLSSHSSLRLAPAREGRAILSRLGDPYLANLTAHEISARTKQKLSRADFAAFQSTQVLEWTPEDEHEILGTFVESMHEEFATRFASLRPFVPPTVDFFVTTGADETGITDMSSPKSRIAYCRGANAVFISRKILDWANSAEYARHLIWHEMWHIVSRNMPRSNIDAMYDVLGFRPMGSRLTNMHPYRLTNPDALYIQHCMDVGDASFVPLLLIDPKFDCFDAKVSVFDHFHILFAMLDKEQLNYEKVYNLHGTDVFQHMLDRMGRNTGYLLHVEEVLAENFAMLARNEDVADEKKSNEIMDRIKRL